MCLRSSKMNGIEEGDLRLGALKTNKKPIQFVDSLKSFKQQVLLGVNY